MTRQRIMIGMLPLVLIALLSVAWRQSRGPAIDKNVATAAQQLYEHGRYDEAVRLYEQLLEQGLENDAVYFNLGNAYYQKGDLALAALNYWHASQLNPRDEDIRANLELIQAQGMNTSPPIEISPVAQLAAASGRWLNINETALLALILWLVLIVSMLVAGRWSGRRRRMARLIAGLSLVLVMLVGLSLGARLVGEREAPGGVIGVPQVTANYEPATSAITDLN